MSRAYIGVLTSALLLAGSLAVGVDASRAAAETAAILEVQQSQQYGSYLTDANGRALYLFMADKGKEGSACYDTCAAAWPPLTTAEPPKTGDPSVQATLLGTVKRRDGSMQVTYGGWPLYYYIRDKQAGQTTGQDIKGFGAEWYLVTPKGEPVHGTH